MTNFIYRRENALSKSLCKSFIDTFELDTENQTKGVICVLKGQRFEFSEVWIQDCNINFNVLMYDKRFFLSILRSDNQMVCR